MNVLYSQTNLHKVQHDGVLRQQLAALSFEVIAQVSILLAFCVYHKALIRKSMHAVWSNRT